MSQNYIILTLVEKNASIAFNNENVAILPREVDGVTPGTTPNLNENSENYALNEDVNLTNKFLVPQRILSNFAYQEYVPEMLEYLADKPYGLCDENIVFLPPEEPI